jgi:heat shock protein HtpX
MFSRIWFFLLTNILVLLTLSVSFEFLGLGKYLYQTTGLNYGLLLVFCSIWGFSGALISLAFSKIIAKRAYRVEIIDPKTEIPELKGLISVVNELSHKAGLSVPPEVGIYDSEEINAFATGPTRNRSMLALSTKMLSTMSMEQIIAVIGHEIGHIANGDMVTMTLVQGTVNSFALFFSRVVSSIVLTNVRSDLRRYFSYFLSVALDVVFTSIGSIFVAWFSRRREYRADQASAKLYSPEHMIDALQFLKLYEGRNNQSEALGLNSMKIESGKKKSYISSLLSSHPIIDDRINALKKRYGIF